MTRFLSHWRTLVCALLLSVSTLLAADARPQIRVGMLQFGTAHWELDQIQRQGLDLAEGFELVLQPLANTSAGLLALTAGSVDWIVSDWLWAAQRTLDGDPMRFIPFSRSIGELIVAADSPIHTLENLPGKRLGVAGGPQGKSWQLLDALARLQGIDLQRQAEVSFAAPPLLNRELAAGRLDAVLTFWHFAARLKAQGYREAFAAAELSAALGLDPQMPMLGYVGRAAWVEEHPAQTAALARAISAAKQQLRDDAPWEAIRPLMRAEAERDFTELKRGFRAGEPPSTLASEQLQSAARMWSLLYPDQPALPLSIFAPLSQEE